MKISQLKHQKIVTSLKQCNIIEVFSLISCFPSFLQIQSMTSLTPGGTRWVSRWASLADTYSDSGPASGLFEIPTQVDLSAGGREILLGSLAFFAFVFASTFHLSY